MIIEQTGNILDSYYDLMLIPVNKYGDVDAYLERDFKKRYPKSYESFKCNKSKLDYLHRNGIVSFRSNTKYRCFFIYLKEAPFELKFIENIFRILRNVIPIFMEEGVKSIAIPALGCGLGGLNWDDVYPLIKKYLGNIKGLTVHVYLPR